MISITVETNTIRRLDHYLISKFPHINKNIIHKLVRTKNIKVNGKRIAANFRVQENDSIEIYSHVQLFQKLRDNIEYSRNTIALAHKIMSDKKIIDTQHFIAINKPGNLPTQGGEGINNSISHALQYWNAEYNTNFKIVHRLDYATSGLLMIAKNDFGAMTLSSMFKNNELKKKYLAILRGAPVKKYGTVSSNIIKIKKDGKFIASNDASGKIAVTDYNVICKNGDYSLVLFEPQTGRMHQIRLHANLLGTCIEGDKLYGSEDNYSDKLMLHALSIAMYDFEGEDYNIMAHIPQHIVIKIKELFNINNIYDIAL